MIKYLAHSVLSPGQEEVEEHMCAQASMQHHQHCGSATCWMIKLLVRIDKILNVFFISILQSGHFPTTCQASGTYRFTDCLYASRHRWRCYSCLTSEDRKIFSENLHLTAEQHHFRNAGLNFSLCLIIYLSPKMLLCCIAKLKVQRNCFNFFT